MIELAKRKTTRLKGYDYNKTGVYFITFCTEDRKEILSRVVGTGLPDGPRIELTEFGKVADKYIRQMSEFYEDITVSRYVIMPNHIHLLLVVSNGPSGRPVPTVQNSIVSRFISTFKRFCNKEYGENIWQPRSYDHIIRDREDFTEHLRYILENPARWNEDELYPE